MNRLIDKSLNSLFKFAERLTGILVQPINKNQTHEPTKPSKICFTKADKWVQGELFD